jgi:lauroyl/myristoyl acyltransferase
VNPVSRAQLRALFPQLSGAATARAAARTAVDRVRNLALRTTLHYFGLPPVRPFVLPNATFDALRAPAIIGTFHIGPTHALGAAIERLPGEVLVLRRRAYAPAQARNVQVAETGGGEELRARAFHRAVGHLRDGGYVLLPIDPAEGARVAAPFLGRSLMLARGAFALARVARAPILPVVTRWRGLRMEIHCGPLIEPGDSEERLAEQAAAWLESYLTAAPGEVAPRVFQLLRES